MSVECSGANAGVALGKFWLSLVGFQVGPRLTDMKSSSGFTDPGGGNLCSSDVFSSG